MRFIKLKRIAFLCIVWLPVTVPVSLRGEEPDWTWSERAVRNAKLYANIQSLHVECDDAYIQGEYLQPRSTEQWRAWWQAWPRQEERITWDWLNQVLVPGTDPFDVSIAHVKSSVHGQRGSAVALHPFLDTASPVRTSENHYLIAEHTEAPDQMHVVRPRLLGPGGLNQWTEPILAPDDLILGLIGQGQIDDMKAGLRTFKKLSEDQRYILDTQPDWAKQPLRYLIDPQTGCYQEYFYPGVILEFAGDFRQVSNGCLLPFRTLTIIFSLGDGEFPEVSSVSVRAIRRCDVNGDFSKQVLHPVKEGEGIHVHQLPTKGGPLFQADKPIADVIEFVEGKLRQNEIVDDSQPVLSTVVILATGIILTLVAVGLFFREPLSRFYKGSR